MISLTSYVFDMPSVLMVRLSSSFPRVLNGILDYVNILEAGVSSQCLSSNVKSVTGHPPMMSSYVAEGSLSPFKQKGMAANITYAPPHHSKVSKTTLLIGTWGCPLNEWPLTIGQLKVCLPIDMAHDLLNVYTQDIYSLIHCKQYP